MQPKVSFVIPTHDCAPFLPHAVSSAKRQSYQNVEIVVVDDCSQDSTAKYLKWLEKTEPRAKIFISNEHLGRSKARNIGNKLAAGDIILVLDADDYAHPGRAKLTVEKIKNGTEFVYGSAEIMDCLGKRIGLIQADKFDLNRAMEKKMNFIVHSTVAYTRRISEEFPYSDDKEVSDLGIDDWEQQIRIASSGVGMDFIPNVLTAYRILESGVSRTRDERKVSEAKARILEGIKSAVPV